MKNIILEQAEEAYILAVREGINLPEMTDEQKIEWYEKEMDTEIDEDEQPF